MVVRNNQQMIGEAVKDNTSQIDAECVFVRNRKVQYATAVLSVTFATESLSQLTCELP